MSLEKLKYGYLPFVLFEYVTEKIYSPSFANNLILMYCFEATSIEGYKKTFNEFVDEFNENSEILVEFLKWLKNQIDDECRRLGLPTDYGEK